MHHGGIFFVTMKETLIQVAETISNAQKVFRNERFYGVVARVHGTFDEKEDTYWFMVGSAPLSMFGRHNLNSLGHYVPRNSYVATRILNNELGSSIDYECLNNIKRMQSHHLVMFTRADLENRTISIVDEKTVYSYSDINEFLSELRNKTAEIEENERLRQEQLRQIEELKKQENTAHERSVLTKGLNKLEEEHRILTLQQEAMNTLTRFIRQQGKLRFNPILDPVQNRIKTQNLFDGKSIVIDGGPGTGKTTTMIQRLKYLTDEYAIEEDFTNETNLYKLTVSQRDTLLNAIHEHKDWVFFSPSRLLKEYLADAMNKEGLTNTKNKVWHWEEFCKTVIRDYYHLFDPTNDNAPFKAGRNSGTLIYQHSGVIEEFNKYFVDQLKSIKSKLTDFEEGPDRYHWTSIALSIQKRFDDTDEFDLKQFIQLFSSLESIYGNECKELLNENRQNIKSVSDEICILLDDKPSLKEKIESLVANNIVEQVEELDDDSEAQDDQMSDKIHQLVRTWFKRYCYYTLKPEIGLTPRQEKITALLTPILTESHKSKIKRIGELTLFEQYAKYTRGIRSNILAGLAAKYKRFRRSMLTSKNAGWNLDLLQSLLQRREGKELHPQEQALLIGFINNLVKTISSCTTSEVKHEFVDAYKELSRPIIGIDEATDFCECDIYAMNSLLKQDFNSLTLCGDMMQRLTDFGITDWTDLNSIISNPIVVEMKTSYRQSTSLLDVAKNLYTDTIGREPNYKAYMTSRKVPAPLAFVSNDEYEKVEWIEQRIKEVYIAYGKRLPSIAIFLNNKDDIPGFVEKLKDTDFILDTNIEIADGSAGNVLANSNQIRVYPIDVVKGMEFDVVFFHNIDSSKEKSDLIKRYIYVGVSRAAFFLGITIKENDEEICKYFELDKKWNKI